jgi:hypothetical protein
MTEHDPMCPQYDQTEHTIAMFDTPCRCEEYARVRADERQRAYPGREVRSQLVRAYAQLSHAEAVAARLVEVICEQEADADRRVDRIILRGALMMADLRAQIAADIEEFRVSLPIETPALSGTVRDRDDMSWVLAMVRDRVARGEQEAK